MENQKDPRINSLHKTHSSKHGHKCSTELNAAWETCDKTKDELLEYAVFYQNKKERALAAVLTNIPIWPQQTGEK